MTLATTGRTDLAKRPTPNKPADLELGAELGSFGGGTVITEAMAKGMSVLLDGGNKNLTAKRIEAMRLDYQVSACLTVLMQPSLRADWIITCEDQDIADQMTLAHERVHVDMMTAMNRATWAGRSPSVLVWDYDETLGMIAVKKFRDLPPLTCLPITDEHGSYAGIWQNKGLGQNEHKIEDVLQTLWVVEGMESGNLLGRSVLGPALDPWLDKLTTRLFRSRYLERFGEPVVDVSYPAGQSVANQAEINAAYAEGKTPPAEVFVTNRDLALNLGNGLRHHSVIALPSEQYQDGNGKALGPKWGATYLEAKRSGGSDFQTAIDDSNRAIARGMFIPDLLFGNTDSGAYALGKGHRSIFDASAEGRLDDQGRQASRHYLQRMATINYGPKVPRVQLEFVGLTDADREKRWEAALAILDKGAEDVDVRALLEDLGMPLRAPEDVAADRAAAEEAAAAAAEREEARAAEAAAAGGQAPPVPPAEGENLRRERIVLTAGAVGDESGMAVGKLPQAGAGRGPWHRELTPRERPMGFAKIESALDTAEATAVNLLCTLLGASRERVLAQVKGILGKGSPAEVLAAVATLNVGSTTPVAAAWEALIREVWLVGLGTVADQLPEYAEKVPSALGPEARAQAKVLAGVNAARHYAALGSQLQLAMLNAVNAGTSLAGVQAILSDVYDAELTSEGRPARLATRMLSAMALNEGRRDGVERGGVPIRGAQYSAILDRRTCPLCERQDEMVVGIESPDLRQYTPPLHHNCRCVWIFITRDELDFTPTWTTPPVSLVDSHASLVVG